jgi:hypothetical protein
MNRVNKYLDFIERVGWTAIQAGAASFVVTGFDDWKMNLGIAGSAAALAAVKVIVAQRVGSGGAGDAIPGGVIEKG